MYTYIHVYIDVFYIEAQGRLAGHSRRVIADTLGAPLGVLSPTL